MNCYICQQPSIGQCQVCWKFYCPEHGDVRCRVCQQERESAGESSGGARMFLLGTHNEPHDHPPNLDAQPVQQVIPVAQSVARANTSMDLVSLELYSGGFIAHFRFRGTPPGESGPGNHGMRSHPEFTPGATDDLGNTYEGQRHGGGGGNGHYRAAVHFSSALAAQAKVLDFTVDEIRWMAFGPGQRSSVQPGPWEFRVEL